MKIYNPNTLKNRKRPFKRRGPRPDVGPRMRLLCTRHGLTGSPTWKTWDGMKQRCFNPKSKDFANYGGRGITVCDRWLLFDNFLADMGIKPIGHSIERKENDLGYSPDNCKWATATEQASNRRSTRLITFNGESLTIAAWSRRLGRPRASIRYRLEAGWSVSDILESPFNKSLKRRPNVTNY